MKTVLLFQSSFSQSNRKKFDGVYHYAHSRKWQIQTIQHAHAVSVRRPNAFVSKPCDLRALLSFWKPDGCIVEGGERSRIGDPKLFGHTPVVFLDRSQETMPKSALCVESDPDAITAAAAKELLSTGYDNFAYVAWWQPLSWSEKRGAAFAAIIRQNGKPCTLLRLAHHPTDRNHALAKSLASLPRPCGILAANDIVAERIVFECGRLGLAVPDDIAVVGIDNDTEICENARVSLTSIEQDCFRAGELAAEMLDQRMSGKKSRERLLKFGVFSIFRRESTRIIKRRDKRVTAAIEFIRRHATTGIRIEEIVRASGGSRRQLDHIFVQLVGHTILDEIHCVRLEHAKTLIASGRQNMSEIAAECGYSSLVDFSRVFKRYEGIAPVKWKNLPR